MIAAIDPGSEKSAIVWLGPGDFIIGAAIYGNRHLRDVLKAADPYRPRPSLLAIEQIASYGMPVGESVFRTVEWCGRFVEAWGGAVQRVPRREVKLHLCGNMRAKDSNIYQALLDRFGDGTRSAAVGTKKKPGPCYGFKKDLWQALGVAVTVADSLPVNQPGTRGEEHAVHEPA